MMEAASDKGPGDDVFPPLSPSYILAFQFSSWYPSFVRWSPKSTVVRPLGQDFWHYLDSDRVFVPDGSEDVVVDSTLSDGDGDGSDDAASIGEQYSFPELDKRIRDAIKEYGAVFPKLNFSSPKLSPTLFILGITQRDLNFYDFMMDTEIQNTIRSTVHKFWEDNIRPNWACTQKDYVFDLLLTRDLSQGHVLDFNPYAARTDPLLFTYEDLHELYSKAGRQDSCEHLTMGASLPELRIVDSLQHPAASRNAPAHEHNRIPVEALSLSEGRNIAEFGEIWHDEVKRAMQEDS
ncbi:hypothetical protein ID866_5732 [Astraeus odoratus]|nr:hypothetical protein ID866_5732 [Astraeus odoratus]